MKDVQSSIDQRGISIQRVGIKEACLPFLIKTKDGGYQQAVARACFTVALPMEYKGTHMSRFLEILNPWSKKPVAEPELAEILQEALDKLQAESASIRIDFKYFVDRTAPVSGRQSVLDAMSFSKSLLLQHMRKQSSLLKKQRNMASFCLKQCFPDILPTMRSFHRIFQKSVKSS